MILAQDGHAPRGRFEDSRALAEADAIDLVRRGLEPLLHDEEDYTHPNCDCGFKCETWCKCGVGWACECECACEHEPAGEP